MSSSKTRISFYRRLYVAHLIDTGARKVPAIVAETGIHRRTIQETIAGLSDIGITCEFVGSNRTGQYEIKEWGPIRRDWVAANHQRLANIISGDHQEAL